MIGSRRLGQSLWVAFLRASGGLWWARRQLRRRGAIVVLMLHRVLDEAEWRQTNSVRGMAVRQRTFEDLAAYLARRCKTVRLDAAEPGTVERRVKIAITFDDAWQDTYTNALPVALARGLPTTVFVCTGLTGLISPFWPERVAAALRARRPATAETHLEPLIEYLKGLGPDGRALWTDGLPPAEDDRTGVFEGDRTMTWEEIAELDRAGVVFGSHTHTHPILSQVGTGVARREIGESRAVLERKLGRHCSAFAYPNGGWSAETRRVLAEEGFRLGFTTERNAWTAETDPLAIPRANVCEENIAGLRGGFSPAMFEYTAFWKVWQAMRTTGRPLAVKEVRERAAA